jgi:hypothetical protein
VYNLIIKRKIEFISFSDGVCDIYEETEEGEKKYKYRSLGYTERTLGYKRYFAAKAAQVQTNAVIRIPEVKGINSHDTLVINGIGRYDIELIQRVNDSNPICLDLTLRQLEMFEVSK